MSVLYVLSGANGVGKTTFYNTILQGKFLETSLPFLNVDLIVKNELGAYTDENFMLAGNLYRERVAALFSAGNDFMIESNLAKDADYAWLDAVKRKGYNVALFFLGTESVEINISRVKKRVKEGGHDIPVPIIEHRYKMSFIYLKSKITVFSEVYLIDNSTEVPKEVAILKEGELIAKVNNDYNWVNNVLFITEKLSNKKNG